MSDDSTTIQLENGTVITRNGTDVTIGDYTLGRFERKKLEAALKKAKKADKRSGYGGKLFAIAEDIEEHMDIVRETDVLLRGDPETPFLNPIIALHVDEKDAEFEKLKNYRVVDTAFKVEKEQEAEEYVEDRLDEIPTWCRFNLKVGPPANKLSTWTERLEDPRET